MTDQMSEAIIQLYGTDPKAAKRVPHATDAGCPHPILGGGATPIIVSLKQYLNEGKIVGFLGQCSTCNKVFYNEG